MVVVVVTAAVVEVGAEVGAALRSVGSLDALVDDDPQPTTSSPAATNATARRDHTRMYASATEDRPRPRWCTSHDAGHATFTPLPSASCGVSMKRVAGVFVVASFVATRFVPDER
jgi:hypothetical protein